MDERPLELQRAVAAAPEDDQARLAFADWLDRQGNPRGEFIRLDLELARSSEDDPARERLRERRRRMLDSHAADWLAELPAFPGVRFASARGPRFERGFPCLVETTWEALGACADELFAAAPITSLVICGEPGYASGEGGAFERPWFRRIRSLEIVLHSAEANHLAARLAAAPNAAGLRRLAFDCWTGLDHTKGVRALAESPHLARLERLALNGHDIGDEEAQMIAGSGTLASLRAYRSKGVQMSAASVVDERGAAAFGASRGFQLRELCLPNHSLEAKGAAAVADGASFSALRVLDLTGNRIRAAGAKALAASRFLTELRELRLGDNRLGAEGIAVLAQSPLVRKLRRLDLVGESLSDNAALELAASPHLRDDCEIRFGLRYAPAGRCPAAEALLRERFPRFSCQDVPEA